MQSQKIKQAPQKGFTPEECKEHLTEVSKQTRKMKSKNAMTDEDLEIAGESPALKDFFVFFKEYTEMVEGSLTKGIVLYEEFEKAAEAWKSNFVERMMDDSSKVWNMAKGL